MNDPKKGACLADTGFLESLGTGDVSAAIRAGMQCGTATVTAIEGVPCMFLPDGMEMVNLEKLLPAPLRIQSAFSFEEPDSFCAYVADFKSDQARLYGNPDEFTITAILDDNQPGKPAWTEHRPALKLRHSPEYEEWKEACGQKLTQLVLADFLDDHMEQIAEPDATELLSDIRSIHVSTNTRCDSVQNEGGDIAFSYSTETSAGTKTARGKIPSRLTLMMAPFRSWHPIQITIALTYQHTKEGALFFVMRMHKAEALVNASYIDVKHHVEEKLGLQVLL